ncbi:MAG: OB-fold domain-containing protein [Thermoplasmata archaeon]
MVGIASLAFHFPVYSIKAEAYARVWGTFRGRGIREKTVAGYDEDEVTLAVEAARKLPADEDVGYLATATFGGPPLATTVAAALGLDASRKADFSGSTNATGEALLSCLDFVEAHGEPALLAAADVPRAAPEDAAEHSLGAAGAALLLSGEGGLQVEATATHTQEAYGELFLDAAGRRRTVATRGPAREVIQRAVKPIQDLLGRGTVATSEPDGLFPHRVLRGLVDAKRIGGGVVELSGDTGCASPLLALMEVAQGTRRGSRLGLVTYGGGSAAALALRMISKPRGLESPGKALVGHRWYLDYPTYARFRRFLAGGGVGEEVSQGAYISLPTYLATVAARYRLVASRCTSCHRVYFPPRLVCLSCGGHGFEEETLSGQGEVYARTLIARGSSPTEFREQQDLIGAYAVALVQLREGPRVVAQLTEVDPEAVKIGMPLEAVLRRIYRQEGVVRYGYKFRPSSPSLPSAETV